MAPSCLGSHHQNPHYPFGDTEYFLGRQCLTERKQQGTPKSGNANCKNVALRWKNNGTVVFQNKCFRKNIWSFNLCSYRCVSLTISLVQGSGWTHRPLGNLTLSNLWVARHHQWWWHSPRSTERWLKRKRGHHGMTIHITPAVYAILPLMWTKHWHIT